MYRQQSIAYILPAWNESDKIGRAVERMPRSLVDEVIVVDDGSSDNTASEALSAGARVLRHEQNQGVGAAIRTGIAWAVRNRIALTGIIAGDNQDDPGKSFAWSRPSSTMAAISFRVPVIVMGGRTIPEPAGLYQNAAWRDWWRITRPMVLLTFGLRH